VFQGGAYHGGDITGGLVKKLMQNACSIFDELTEFLKEVKNEKNIMEEPVWENLAERMRITMLCLESFDGLFSRLQSAPTEENPASKMWKEAASFLVASLKYWHLLGLSITPKIHMLEDHILFKLKFEKGLWNKDEEFIK